MKKTPGSPPRLRAQGLLPALLLGLLANAPLAQSAPPEPARQKVLGKALQVSGEPWANATVRLVAWPYPRYWFVGSPDERTVKTDADGRWQAELLPQRHYSAWAFAGLDDGGYRITEVVDDVVPASLVELRERALQQAPVRVRIVQPDGAGPFGPLTFRVISRTPTQPFVHDLELDENGEADLPPVPSSIAWIEALTAGRVRVWTTHLYTTAARRAAAAERGAHERDPMPPTHVMTGARRQLSILRLPEPTPVTFTVTDGEGPVGGAEVLVGAQTSAGSISDVHDCRVLTRTDASGVAQVPMYLSWNQDGELAGSRPDVVVRSDRHVERLYRMMRDLRGEDAQLTRGEPAADVRLTGPSFVAKGRLLLAPDAPARGVPVLIYDSYSIGIGHSHTSSTRPIVTVTDASGAFAFPGRAADRDYRITALLPTDEPHGREEVYLSHSHDAQAGGDHGDLIASQSVRVDFQVKTPEGLPADRVRLYLAEERDRPRTPLTFLTDRSGRCTVRVPREQLLCVIAASDDGFAAARLDHPGAAARLPQTLQLKIGGVLTGTAVDPDGAPLANVRVSIMGGDGVRTWYSDLLRDVSSTTYALDYRGTYTDAEGRFRAVFPEAGVALRVSAWRRGADGAYLQLVGGRRELELDDDIEPLRLVLDESKRQ